MKNAPPDTRFADFVIATEEADVKLQRQEVQWLMDRFRRDPTKCGGKWLDMEWRHLQWMETNLDDMRRAYGAR
jgi:hypothetical protein